MRRIVVVGIAVLTMMLLGCEKGEIDTGLQGCMDTGMVPITFCLDAHGYTIPPCDEGQHRIGDTCVEIDPAPVECDPCDSSWPPDYCGH